MRGSSNYLQELRELTNLDGAACLVRRDELELGRTPASLAELKAKRPKNRIDTLLTKVRLISYQTFWHNPSASLLSVSLLDGEPPYCLSS